MAGRGGDQRAGQRAEPVGGDGGARPFGDFRRGAGDELILGIGGDEDAGVDARIQPPLDQHGDERGLADAMARGAGEAQRGVAGGAVLQVRADAGEDIGLPGARAGRGGELAPAPRPGETGVAEGVVAEACDGLDEAGGGGVTGAVLLRKQEPRVTGVALVALGSCVRRNTRRGSGGGVSPAVLLRKQEPRVMGAAFVALGSCLRRNTRRGSGGGVSGAVLLRKQEARVTGATFVALGSCVRRNTRRGSGRGISHGRRRRGRRWRAPPPGGRRGRGWPLPPRRGRSTAQACGGRASGRRRWFRHVCGG